MKTHINEQAGTPILTVASRLRSKTSTLSTLSTGSTLSTRTTGPTTTFPPTQTNSVKTGKNQTTALYPDRPPNNTHQHERHRQYSMGQIKIAFRKHYLGRSRHNATTSTSPAPYHLMGRSIFWGGAKLSSASRSRAFHAPKSNFELETLNVELNCAVAPTCYFPLLFRSRKNSASLKRTGSCRKNRSCQHSFSTDTPCTSHENPNALKSCAG